MTRSLFYACALVSGTALDDPDEAIAKMAEKALADLEALEESRALD